MLCMGVNHIQGIFMFLCKQHNGIFQIQKLFHGLQKTIPHRHVGPCHAHVIAAPGQMQIARNTVCCLNQPAFHIKIQVFIPPIIHRIFIKFLIQISQSLENDISIFFIHNPLLHQHDKMGFIYCLNIGKHPVFSSLITRFQLHGNQCLPWVFHPFLFQRLLS